MMPYAPLVLDPMPTIPATVPTDLPAWDSVPVCEHAVFNAGTDPCDSAAAWRMRLAHMRFSDQCEPRSVLVCDNHYRLLMDSYRELLGMHGRPACLWCTADLRSVSDVVLSVVAL